ncbi:MAG: hypothetical protein JST82_13835 [Bacteroidetes bacterium]|nr:hypothetical protein [Bacteroidota bacterium]
MLKTILYTTLLSAITPFTNTISTMSVNDVIVLLTLIIAIFALINERNRRHLLLKLGTGDYVLFSVAFIAINYFVYYESFSGRGIYLPFLYFKNFGFRQPRHWAYCISLVSLLYLGYKIWAPYFFYSKCEKLLVFYRQQIENNNISFLIELLEKYHKGDIIRYIDRSKDFVEDRDWWERRLVQRTFREKAKERWEKGVLALFPFSPLSRRMYAQTILSNIIADPAFVSLAANEHPYFFADLFKHFKPAKRDAFPRELIQSYFRELLAAKNFWLKKELIDSEKHDSGQPGWFFKDNRILSALFMDLGVADINNVWIPFGEAAVNEINEERFKGLASKLFQGFINEQILWEFKTYYAVQFLKFLLIEAIIKGYTDSHFWLYYYDRITENILKTFDTTPPDNFEREIANYHQLVEIMVDNLLLWLKLSNERAHPGIYVDIIRCLGSMLEDITRSPYYGDRRKLQILDTLLSRYCRLQENAQTDQVKTVLENMLRQPSATMDNNHPYFGYMATVWQQFDKIPHRINGQDRPYFARLKANVITPLGLNPNLNV